MARQLVQNVCFVFAFSAAEKPTDLGRSLPFGWGGGNGCELNLDKQHDWALTLCWCGDLNCWHWSSVANGFGEQRSESVRWLAHVQFLALSQYAFRTLVTYGRMPSSPTFSYRAERGRATEILLVKFSHRYRAFLWIVANTLVFVCAFVCLLSSCFADDSPANQNTK